MPGASSLKGSAGDASTFVPGGARPQRQDAGQGAGCRRRRGGLRPRGCGGAGRQGGRAGAAARDARGGRVARSSGGDPGQCAGDGPPCRRSRALRGARPRSSHGRGAQGRVGGRRGRRGRGGARAGVDRDAGRPRRGGGRRRGERPVVALILGYADLAAALGRRGAERDLDRWLVAQETVLAAARIGDAQAIDGPFFVLRDERGVARAARAARELGFDGKWAIHPEQVAPLNAAFAPSAEERRWATRGRGGRRRGVRCGWRRRHGRRRDGRRGDGAPGAPAAGAALRHATGAGRARPRDRCALLRGPRRRDDVPRAGRDADRGPCGAAPGDRGRSPAARARCRPLRGGHGDGGAARPSDARVRRRHRPVDGAERAGARQPLLPRASARGRSGSAPRCGRRTEVVARRDGLATGAGSSRCGSGRVDAQGEPVLDFWRAPLLPAREARGHGGRRRPDGVGTDAVDAPALVPASWDLEPLRAEPLGPCSRRWAGRPLGSRRARR